MLIDIDQSDNDALIVTSAFSEKWRIDPLPSKVWHKAAKIWQVPITPVVINYLRSNFKRSEFTAEAIARLKAAVANPVSTKPGVFPGLVPSCLMAHQRNALDRAFDKPQFFFAHAMGTGKTLTVLTLAAYLNQHKNMEGLLVICPSTIKHDVWESQINQWLPQLNVPYDLHIVDAGHTKTSTAWINRADRSKLRIMVVGTQALSNASQSAFRLANLFLEGHYAGMVVDESSKIKSPKANRTNNIIDLAELAHWRWACTGTKITQGIHDLYAQFRYLNWTIIGQKSYFTFRNRYCIMGGFENRSIVAYNNIQELMDLIAPYIDVVRKEDANDLPPKTYQVRRVTLSAEQKRLYAELHQDMSAQIGDDILSVSNMLDRMTRYQQIVGGHFPFKVDDNSPWDIKPLATNPKLDELLEVVEETSDKVIIWARFVPEIQAIYKALVSVYGSSSAVMYYGVANTEDRAKAIEKFRFDPNCRFFIANQQTGGMGLTLVEASLVIYYSNSFSWEDRTQSEDRNHRTGQTHPVTYIDILSDSKIDRDIQKALLTKKSMATFISDKLRSGESVEDLL